MKAILAIDGAPPLAARTVDISPGGVAVAVENPVRVGQPGHIRFDLYFDGKATPIVARSKVSYCIFSQGAFKVGLQFVSIDLSAMTMLSKFLGSRPGL